MCHGKERNVARTLHPSIPAAVGDVLARHLDQDGQPLSTPMLARPVLPPTPRGRPSAWVDVPGRQIVDLQSSAGGCAVAGVCSLDVAARWREMLAALAIFVGLSPRARRAWAAASLSASMTVGRPPVRP